MKNSPRFASKHLELKVFAFADLANCRALTSTHHQRSEAWDVYLSYIKR